LFLLVSAHSQTISAVEDPDWTRDGDWTEAAPQYDTERDATLIHDCEIPNRDLTVNHLVTIDVGVTFLAKKAVTITSGGILQIDGTMEMHQEFVIEEGGHLIVCGLLIGAMNNPEVIVNEGMITVCEGGVLDWEGAWDCNGGTIIVDGTIIVEDDFENMCDIDGGGEIIIEDGDLINTPPGSLFGCELPDDECCEYVDGQCRLPDTGGAGTPIHISVQNGNWTDPTTWDVNAVPGVGDAIIISTGHTVLLDHGAGPTVSDFQIDSTAIFLQLGIPLEVTGDYTNNGNHRINGDQLLLSGMATSMSGEGNVTLLGVDDQARVTISGDKTVSPDALLNFFGSGHNGGVVIHSTVTNNGEMQMATPVTGTGLWLNAGFSKLRLFSSFNITLDATAEGNTVYYQDIADQDVVAPVNGVYHDLVIGGQQTKTLTSDIVVQSSLFIDGASTLDVDSLMNYTIEMQGDWLNANGTFLEQKGRVIMKGSTDQNVQQSFGIETFYDLEIDNVGIGIVLHNNVLVINSLTMIKGDVATGPKDAKLVLGTGLDNIGTLIYTSGTIYSKFERWITNASSGVLFPIGTYPKYTGIIFTSESHTLGSLIVEFTPAAPGNEGSPWVDQGSLILYQQTFTDGYWNIEGANGFSSSNFNLNCNIDELQGFPILGDERILYRQEENLAWKFQGIHGENNGTVVSRQALANFGQFALAATNDCVVPPPDQIIGESIVCLGQTSVTYTAFELNPAMHFYFWLVVGGTITSGQGTSEVTVDWSDEVDLGVIRVRTIDESCGVSESIEKHISFDPLPTSPISGETVVFENSVRTYSVEGNINYTYHWTVTGGQQINGGTSSSIEVQWGDQGAGVVQVDAEPPGDCPDASAVFLDVILFETYTSIRTGNWDDPGTWNANQVPTFLADVLVSENTVVSLNVDANVSNLTIDGELIHTASGNSTIIVVDQYIVNGIHNATRPSIDVILLTSIQPSLIGGTGTINAYNISVLSNEWTLSQNADLTINAVEFIIDDANFLVRGRLSIGDNIQTVNGGSFQCSFGGSTVSYSSAEATQPIFTPDDAYYNLEIDGGGIKNVENDIVVRGDLTILDGILTSGEKKITLSGITLQMIKGGSAIKIDDLEINNRSTLDPGVIVTQNLSINGSLILTEGIVRILPGNELRISNIGNNTPGSLLSFVDGKFTRELGSSDLDYIFPVGDGGIYSPAVLHPANFTGDRTFSVEYFRMGHSNQMTDGTFAVISPVEYWDITDVDGTGADQIRLYYSPESLIPEPDSALIAHLNASLSVWEAAGVESTPGSDMTGDFIATTDVTDFSPFTFGLVNDPLPIELISFTGRLDDKDAILNWVTASETNNAQFELEHSADGRDFDVIHVETGSGTTTTNAKYNYVHRNISNGLHYYRLKQIDLDGTFEYSPIVVLKLDSDENASFLHVYPNPSNGSVIQFTVNHGNTNSDIELSLYDMRGILVSHQKIFSPSGQITGSMMLNTVPGTYLLMVTTPHEVLRSKIVVTGH